MTDGWMRMDNSPAQEHAAALVEIAKIAAHRYDDLLAGANPSPRPAWRFHARIRLMSVLVLDGAHVVTMDGLGRELETGDVVIDGNRIDRGRGRAVRRRRLRSGVRPGRRG